jgi:hypothetical protein
MQQSKKVQLKTFHYHFSDPKEKLPRLHFQMLPDWNSATTGILIGQHFEE